MRGARHVLWATAAVVAIVAVVATLVLRGGPDLSGKLAAPSPGPASPGVTQGAQRPGHSTSTAGRAPALGPLPLPSTDTPFRLVIDELQARARAGDATARCRLAAEHANCNHIRAALASADRSMERQLARIASMEGEERQARIAASSAEYAGERSERLLERSAHCEGVPPQSPAEIVRQWRAAARSGSRPAMVHYAVGNAFAIRDTLDVLPELEVYRAEAESIARSAASRGSVSALVALAAAYLPTSGDASWSTFLTQVVDQDPVEALALYLVLQSGLPDGTVYPYMRHTRHVVTDRVARLQASLTPADRARAARRASELQAEWGPFKVEQVHPDLLLHGAIRGEFMREACDAALADKVM